MKIAYFDCFAGIAGDMTLGALLDCGAPLDELKAALSSLDLQGWDIETAPVLKSGIHALSVRITQNGISDDEELAHSHSHAGHHHDHEHHHEEEHSHDHQHHHAHEDQHGRSMGEIRALIETSDLSPRVREMSLKIFYGIAVVEAKMHHTTPDEIHFHEIGGVDSILDIVGVAWCLEFLGVEEAHFSALPTSSGFVDCAHGRMPVPAPATMELLRGVPMISTDIRGEMVTPTGAGIVAALGQGFGPMPNLTPLVIGHGAGKKEWPDRPNMLRVVIGETPDSSKNTSQRTAETLQSTALADSSSKLIEALPGLEWKALNVVECNIDDMNPEFFALVMERLLDGGALDVWVQAAQMKKNRPAWLLSALCDPADCALVIATILRETTTLGVRVQSVQRAAMERRQIEVETHFGGIGVKLALWPEGDVRRATPEWENVQGRAREHNVAAQTVYQAAQNAVPDWAWHTFHSQ